MKLIFSLILFVSACVSTPKNISEEAKQHEATYMKTQNTSNVTVHTNHQSPPPGWKAPKKIPNSGCDRSKDDFYTVFADFDGDGRDDIASLFTKTNGKGLGLWVKLNSKKEATLVAATDSTDGQHDMGIALAEPGKYQTLCGKGYEACANESDAEFDLKLPAIDFFTCESANRFLYWDKAKKKFIEEWMSD